MQVNFLTKIIGSAVGFGIVYLITGQIQWGIIVGLLIGVGSAKWFRVKKQEASDEIEYDERVNNNMKLASLQTFSISNLMLFVYLNNYYKKAGEKKAGEDSSAFMAYIPLGYSIAPLM